jgi:hypothetical protein
LSIEFEEDRTTCARPRSEYDVIAALPDGEIEKPLGLVEDREKGLVPAPAAGWMEAEPDLSLAAKSKLPAKLEPQLATLAATPPSGAGGCWTPSTTDLDEWMRAGLPVGPKCASPKALPTCELDS